MGLKKKKQFITAASGDAADAATDAAGAVASWAASVSASPASYHSSITQVCNSSFAILSQTTIITSFITAAASPISKQ